MEDLVGPGATAGWPERVTLATKSCEQVPPMTKSHAMVLRDGGDCSRKKRVFLGASHSGAVVTMDKVCGADGKEC